MALRSLGNWWTVSQGKSWKHTQSPAYREEVFPSRKCQHLPLSRCCRLGSGMHYLKMGKCKLMSSSSWASQQGKKMLTSAWKSNEALCDVVWPEVLTPWPGAFRASGKHVIRNRARDFSCFQGCPWTVKKPRWANLWCCFSLFQEMYMMPSFFTPSLSIYNMSDPGMGTWGQLVTSSRRRSNQQNLPGPLSLAITPGLSSLSWPSWFYHVFSLPHLPVTPQSTGGCLCPHLSVETSSTEVTRNLSLSNPRMGLILLVTQPPSYVHTVDASLLSEILLSLALCHCSLMVFTNLSDI